MCQVALIVLYHSVSNKYHKSVKQCTCISPNDISGNGAKRNACIYRSHASAPFGINMTLF